MSQSSKTTGGISEELEQDLRDRLKEKGAQPEAVDAFVDGWKEGVRERARSKRSELAKRGMNKEGDRTRDSVLAPDYDDGGMDEWE